MAQGDQPLLVREVEPQRRDRDERPARSDRFERSDRGARDSRDGRDSRDSKPRAKRDGFDKDNKKLPPPDEGLERYRIDAGHTHGLRPSNIVGAIANEVDIDSSYIGRIEIYTDYTTVDLPEGMPKEVFQHLKKVRVAGRPMNIVRFEKPADESAGDAPPKAKPRKRKPV
jgi:ATP-dependent RNA helicase DeaD